MTATFREVERGLSRSLGRLVVDPGRWILILKVEVSERYVQFLADEAAGLHAEVVSNTFLEGDDLLSVDDEFVLLALGWHAPAGLRRPNFYTADQPPVTVEEVADRAIATLRDVLGVKACHRLEITLFRSALDDLYTADD